jgi:hypothetical protein
MAISSGSTRRIAYVAESTYATTPATPVFKILRATGGGLRTVKQTGSSAEIRSDRNVPDLYQTAQDVNGSYAMELTYGSFDDFMEAALFGAWTTNVLKNGVALKSFTVEETIDLGADGSSFSRFTGAMINRFSLNVASRAAITGSFELMAQQETLDTAIVTGATYTAPNTNPVFNGAISVGSLVVASLSPVPKLKSITIDVNNGLRIRDKITSLYSEQFGYDRCVVTGTMVAYFETNDLYAAVLAHGGGAVSVRLGNTAGSRYTITLPNVIFGNGERQPGNNSTDVMVSIPYQAVYDPGANACSIKITRAV